MALQPQERHFVLPMATDSVGDRLRRFRRLRRLSQEQLSELSGVRRDYIGSLEASPTKVPREPDQLRLLANALGVRLQDLAQPTGWYDDLPASPSWEDGIMSDPRFSDEAKQALVTLMRGLLANTDKQA